MKIILIFSFLFGSVFVIKDQAFSDSDKMTYEKAVNISKESNKLIMMKLTANNCKYCIKMDNEVLSDLEVQEVLSKNFITLNINVDEESLPLGLKRPMTPTFVFIDKNQKIVSTVPGSWNKSDFLELLDARIKN